MAFREVRVFEIREVLRLRLPDEAVRATERLVRVDRKTVRRYVEAAVELGLVREGGVDHLTDVFIGSIVEAGGRIAATATGRHGGRCRTTTRL